MTKQRQGLRHKAAVLVAATLVISGALAVPLTALAADGPFTIDGTVPDAGTTELPDLFGNVKELGPLNSNTTKIGVIHNDAVPTLDLTNPNGQVDLRRAWLDTERDTGTNHDWLYFAWERDANSGSGFIAYEFMQNPAPAGCAYDTATDAQLIANCNPWANRKAGDFMILWDQQGNSLDLYLRTWTGTAPNLTLGAPTLLNAAVSQAAYSADGFRGEAAVDLTATIFGGSTACRSFANTIPSTVTGNSDTADYKDTILKTAPPITNCTSTTVTTPKTGAGANIPAGGALDRHRRRGRQGLGRRQPHRWHCHAGRLGRVLLCKVDAPGAVHDRRHERRLDEPDRGGLPGHRASRRPPTSPRPAATAGGPCSAVTPPTASRARATRAATECFTVNPVTPTLSTTAGADVHLGNAVTDSATLSGTATQPANPVINLTGTAGAAAGGTITFKLYGPSTLHAGRWPTPRPTVAVSGNGTYNTPAPQFVPTARRRLPLGRRLQRQLAEHQRHHPQRRLHRHQRGRRRSPPCPRR